MASLFSDRTEGSLQISGCGWDGERPCHMRLPGLTLLELHPRPVSLVLSVFLGRIISLQMITTPLQKQQACLGEARTAQALPGREEQISRFLSKFPLPPCGILLLPPALSSLPFPQDVQLLSCLRLRILQWPVTTWAPSSNRKGADLGWGWLKAHFFYSSFKIPLKRRSKSFQGER